MRVQWILMSEERDRTLAIAGWNADEHFRPPGSAVLNRKFAGVAQLVERQISNLNVAGSKPVARSIYNTINGFGVWRSLVARPPGGRKVVGSNPATPTINMDVFPGAPDGPRRAGRCRTAKS